MWAVFFSNESIRTLSSFNMPGKKRIMAGIRKAAGNPLPFPEGYGQPLSDKNDTSPPVFFKIDIREADASVVYSMTEETRAMNILFIIKT